LKQITQYKESRNNDTSSDNYYKYVNDILAIKQTPMMTLNDLINNSTVQYIIMMTY